MQQEFQKHLRVGRSVLTAVNAFLLAFFLFLSATAALLYGTVLNPDFMVQVLAKQGFTDQIYAEYTRQLEYLAEPAGVDAQVLKDIIGKAEMAQDLQQKVYYEYDPNHPKAKIIDTEATRLRFATKLTEYAQQQGYTIEKEVQAGIDNISNLARLEYSRYTTLPFVNQMGGYIRSAKSIVKLGIFISLGMWALLSVCMFLGKGRSGVQKSVGLIWALSGAGLLTGIWPVGVLLYGKLEYLNIQLKSLYLFMQGYIKDILYIFIAAGALFLVLALVAYLFIYRPQSKKEVQ